MIKFRHKGDFSGLERYLGRSAEGIPLSVLDKYGQEGVRALSASTPKDTGTTAGSWYYRTEKSKGVLKLIFCNSNIQNGTPVAVVIPTSSIYKDLGYDLGLTNSAPTEAYAKSLVEAKASRGKKTPSPKLLAFGIGKNAECVRNQLGLGEAPYNPVYDKTNYRQYLALFWIKPGGQGVAGSCTFVGVVDCAGKTYRAAEYDVNWTTQLDAE